MQSKMEYHAFVWLITDYNMMCRFNMLADGTPQAAWWLLIKWFSGLYGEAKEPELVNAEGEEGQRANTDSLQDLLQDFSNQDRVVIGKNRQIDQPGRAGRAGHK